MTEKKKEQLLRDHKVDRNNGSDEKLSAGDG
jgi:hypothetical protein